MKKISIISCALLLSTTLWAQPSIRKAPPSMAKEEQLQARLADYNMKGPSAALKSVTATTSCSMLIEDRKDNNGKTYQMTKEMVVIGIKNNDGSISGFGMDMSNFDYKGQKVLIVDGVVVDKGVGVCMDEKSVIAFILEDGEKLLFMNYGKPNCNGTFTLYLGVDFGFSEHINLEKLKKSKITTMAVLDKEAKLHAYNPASSTKEAIQRILGCL